MHTLRQSGGGARIHRNPIPSQNQNQGCSIAAMRLMAKILVASGGSATVTASRRRMAMMRCGANVEGSEEAIGSSRSRLLRQRYVPPEAAADVPADTDFDERQV